MGAAAARDRQRRESAQIGSKLLALGEARGARVNLYCDPGLQGSVEAPFCPRARVLCGPSADLDPALDPSGPAYV